MTMKRGWLNDEWRERRGLLVAAVLLLAALIGGALWWLRAPPMPPSDAQPAAPALSTPSALPSSAVAESTPVTAPASAAAAGPATCPHQQLMLSLPDGTAQRTCVAATTLAQNGGLRSYLLEPEGTSTWSLRVDTTRGTVVGAQLSERGGRVAYACVQEACKGFSIGVPDAYGVRVLKALEVSMRADAAAAAPEGAESFEPLRAAEPARAASSSAGASGSASGAGTAPAVAAKRPLVLSASLAVAPDGQHPFAPCATSALAIVETSGAVGALCPGAGAGISFLDGGKRRYSFQDNGGRELEVTVAPDGSVASVVLDNRMRCEQTACGGISVQVHGDPANPTGGRTFTFASTVLMAGAPSGHRATLDGELVTPPQ